MRDILSILPEAVHMVERAAAAAKIETVGDRACNIFFCTADAFFYRISVRQTAGDSGGKCAACSVGIWIFDMFVIKPDGFAAA